MAYVGDVGGVGDLAAVHVQFSGPRRSVPVALSLFLALHLIALLLRLVSHGDVVRPSGLLPAGAELAAAEQVRQFASMWHCVHSQPNIFTVFSRTAAGVSAAAFTMCAMSPPVRGLISIPRCLASSRSALSARVDL